MLRAAVGNYRTVPSQDRVPQASELTAAAAICLTAQEWIEGWNSAYRTAQTDLTHRLQHINHRLGYQAVWADPIGGGWYPPLCVARRLLPGAASSVDAFAALLHYGDRPDSGIALLPGELFGHRTSPADRSGSFLLRGTLAAGDRELRRFVTRLGHAATAWSGPDGPDVIGRALRQARLVADLDTILTNSRY